MTMRELYHRSPRIVAGEFFPRGTVLLSQNGAHGCILLESVRVTPAAQQVLALVSDGTLCRVFMYPSTLWRVLE